MPEYSNSSLPADRHFAITPDDGTDLAIKPRSIYVGGGGDIVLRDGGGTDVTYTVADGAIIPFRVTRILDTGTTATNIVGWY